MFGLYMLKERNLKLQNLLVESLQRLECDSPCHSLDVIGEDNGGKVVYGECDCGVEDLRRKIENVLLHPQRDPEVKSSPLDIWEKALVTVIYELNKFRDDLNFLLKDSELIRNAIFQAEHEMRLNLISKFQHQIKETEKL